MNQTCTEIRNSDLLNVDNKTDVTTSLFHIYIQQFCLDTESCHTVA